MDFEDSLDEEEPVSPMTSDENNKDYMEPCDIEVNDILPRFQRLNIDDELQELQPEITNNPCTSTEKNSSVVLWSSCEHPSMLDSSVKLSPKTYSGVSGEPSEVTEATTDKEPHFSVTEKITGDIWAVKQINNHSQDIIQKETSLSYMHPLNQKEKKLKEDEEIKLNEEENVLDKSSLNPCLIHKLDHSYAAEPSSTAFENETKPVSIVTVQKMYLETDEILDTSSNIIQEKGYNEGTEHTNETASNKIVDLESPRVSYSADVSSDDQSNMNCDVRISSNTLDSNLKDKASGEAKRKRKTPILVPSDLQINQNRQRRFSMFQLPSSNIAESQIRRNIYSSDEYFTFTSTSDLQINQNRQRRFSMFQFPSSNIAESQIQRNISSSDEYFTFTSTSDLQMNQSRQRRFSIFRSPSSNIAESEIPRDISNFDKYFTNTSASDLQMNQIRRGRFSGFQSPSSNIAESEIPRNISTSDEVFINTSASDLLMNQTRPGCFSIFQSPSTNIAESEIPRNISTSDGVFKNRSASDLQMNQIRQKRFSSFQSLSSNLAEREIRRNISTSDEDSKNANGTAKRPHINSRKRRQKNDKSSSEKQSLIHSNEKTEEKNRSSVSKRKISTAELVQNEKICKRSISEKNSESSKKPHLETRSRSKSSSQ